MIGLGGLQDPSKKTLLVVLYGFEHHRAIKTIEEYEPAKVLLGFGGTPTEIDFLKRNRDELGKVRMLALSQQEVEEFDFPADSITNCAASLKEVVNPYVETHNIVVAPMSTKLSTIAAYLVAKQYPQVQVSYCVPGEYNMESYSQGTRRFSRRNWPKPRKGVGMMQRIAKPVAIELFSGAGGLSLGFELAGFTIAVAVEKEPYAAATYRHNHPDTVLIENDVQLLDPIECLNGAGTDPDCVAAVICGLPCQGFSESNRRTRTLSNPRNHLYVEFLRFVSAIKPAFIVVENVAGMKTMAGGEVIRRIVEGCGAGVRDGVLRAQRR